MSKIRIQFIKTGNIKFISHLDLSKLMERTFRRLQVPLSFTQGYNPHPKISFATALALGVSSEGEYMDIEVEGPIDLNILKEEMNKQLPKGIQIVECIYVDREEPSLMSMIDYGIYIVKCELYRELGTDFIIESIDKFMNLEEFWVKKATKKGKKNRERQINILPLIKKFEFIDKDILQLYFKLIVATGSKHNIKPEIVVNSFFEYFRIENNMDKMRIHRLDLYIEKDGNLLTPMEVSL